MAVPYRKHQSLLSRFLVPGLVLAGGGIALYFSYTLVRDGAAPHAPPPPEGWRPVLICPGIYHPDGAPTPIPIYTKLTRDNLWNPRKGDWSFTYMDPAQITSTMMTGPQCLGRVLKHNKPPGYAFTEDDFFPKGTKAGYLAGVPEGWRAITLQADKVDGLVRLEDGDRFDIVSTTPIDPKALESVGTGYGQQAKLDQVRLGRQALVRTVVHAGIIVLSLQTRQIPTTSSSLFRGQTTQGKPVQEVVIATDPNDAVLLLEALGVEPPPRLTCLPRSSRPDDDPSNQLPGKSSDALAGPSGTGRMAIIDVRAADKHEFKATEQADGDKK